MTLDEARKLKVGDKILICEHSAYFLAVNRNGDVVYEYSDGGTYTESPKYISYIKKEPVYEWRWVFKTSKTGIPPNSWLIMDDWYTEEERTKHLLGQSQRIDITKRPRE